MKNFSSNNFQSFVICRLPLVPRRPLSAFEPTDNKKRSNQAAAKKQRSEDANAGEPTPPPPDDMDERLIFDAHRLATQYVNDMVMKTMIKMKKDDVSSFSHRVNKPMLKLIQRRPVPLLEELQPVQQLEKMRKVLEEKMPKVIKKVEKIRLEKVQRVKERKERRKMNLFKKVNQSIDSFHPSSSIETFSFRSD